MAPYRFTYTGIRVKDMDESVAFYTKVLGMRLQFRMKLKKTNGEYALLQSPRSRQTLELNWYRPGTRFATPYVAGEGLDHIAFRTPHLGEAIRELRKQGIPIVEGPIGDRANAWAYIEDPNGIWVELIGPLRKRKKRTG